MTELKPCPFCGWNKARLMERKIAGSYGNYGHSDFVRVRVTVMCNKCKATSPSIVSPKLWYEGREPKFFDENREFENLASHMKYRRKAIEAWNRRVEE